MYIIIKGGRIFNRALKKSQKNSKKAGIIVKNQSECYYYIIEVRYFSWFQSGPS